MNTFNDQDVEIDNLKISRNLYSHEELASLDVVIGDHISDEMEERATEDAKQQFISGSTQRWFGKPRASGTVHRIRAVDACEHEADVGARKNIHAAPIR